MTQRYELDSNAHWAVGRARSWVYFSVWLSSYAMNHICLESATPWQFLRLFFDSFFEFSKDQLAEDCWKTKIQCMVMEYVDDWGKIERQNRAMYYSVTCVASTALKSIVMMTLQGDRDKVHGNCWVFQVWRIKRRTREEKKTQRVDTVCMGWIFLFSFFVPYLACYWKAWVRALYCPKTSL